MNVLMISTDRKIFEDGSMVRSRMLEYGKLFDELHIIVFSKERNKTKISDNIFIYSTNSMSKFFYIINAVKIGKKIVKTSPNNFIITTQDPFETGISGWLIAKKFKIKLQLQIHTDFLSRYFVQKSLLNRLRVVVAKFLLPKTNCIRVVSKRIADTLKTIVDDSKIQILPIFIDIEKIKNVSIKVDLRKKYPQFDFIILMSSRLEKEKNISLAIFIMKEIIKEYPKTGLIIVGEGRERKSLKSQISSLKLDGNVIFDGWQNKDVLFSYYKTADLFLLTSDYEGYGMTIIEALAAGLPVISTDVGVAREAGAKVIERVSMKKDIIEYMGKNKEMAELKNYPYKNKQDYLEKFKKLLICVS